MTLIERIAQGLTTEKDAELVRQMKDALAQASSLMCGMCEIEHCIRPCANRMTLDDALADIDAADPDQ